MCLLANRIPYSLSFYCCCFFISFGTLLAKSMSLFYSLFFFCEPVFSFLNDRIEERTSVFLRVSFYRSCTRCFNCNSAFFQCFESFQYQSNSCRVHWAC